MNRTKLLIASAVFLALTAVKFLLPELGAPLREAIARSVTRESEALSTFLHRSAEPEDELQLGGKGVAAAEEIAAAPVCLSYRIEEAENRGEAEAAPHLPAAVAAFLESQAAFADFALPENVDYAYQPLPFACAAPIAGAESSGFGYRMHPILGEVRFHYGTDLAAETGDAVCAFADGTVCFAGFCDSYGNYIRIAHADGWESLYAHCSSLSVQAGEQVTAGEEIARAGATGQATGPHLHFELQNGGVYVNPEYYLSAP